MRLLIIGKLQGHIGTASKIAYSRGANIVHVESIDGAMNSLRSGKGADLILADVVMDIHALKTGLERERINVPIVACGIGSESEPAVKAIESGAKEYLPLPPNADLIAALLETVSLPKTAMVFQDPSMKSVVHLAQQIAPSDASVLITGESGTGKEIMARYIHQNSRRHQKPFISVNCAAIPEALLESELFGHEKGAFTGAIARRIGKFEEASGGTILLDEVTEMHPMLQAKLLRALQEKEIDRLGGSKPVKVDIRIIATSNRKMEEAVAQGQFRQDLYFRLNVVTLHLPPLRDRPLDIEPLSDFFMKKYAEANGLFIKPLSQECRQALRVYPWHGNIRELENTLHRSVLLAQNHEVRVSDFGLTLPTKAETSGSDAHGIKSPLIGRTVADVERDLILGTLSHCLGNRTQAATLLGISIRTLRNKLKSYTQDNELAHYQEA